MGAWGKIFVGTLFTVVAAVAMLAVALAWRLSLGPIPLPALDRRLEQALSGIAPGLVARVEHTEIAWLRHLPELRVLGVKLERQDGKLLLSVPALGIRPSLRAAVRGQLAVERVSVAGVHVSLVRDESGKLLLGAADGGEPPVELSGLAGPGGDGGGTRYLKRIRIYETTIHLVDRTAGTRWRLDDTRLEITRRGGAFELEAAARLHMESPSSAIVRVLSLPFTAEGTVQRGEDGALGDARFQLKAEGGNVAPAGPPGPPVPLRTLASEGSLSIGSRRLELRTLHARIGSAELDSTASVSIDAPYEGLDLEGEIRSLPVAELQRLWPPSAASATREWIVQNIHDGTVPRCRFAIHLPKGEAAMRPVPAEAVNVAFDFEGLTVEYLRELTPVQQTRGSATLNAERFDAVVAGGEIGRLHLDAGQVEVRFRGGPARLKVAADVTGTTGEVLAVLERPPLEIPQAIGIAAQGVEGTSANHVEIELPLKQGLRASDVIVRAKAELRQAKVGDLFGVVLEDGDLQVRVDGKRVDVEGEARLEGLPVPVDRARLAVAFAPGSSGAPDQLSVSVDGKELSLKSTALLDGRKLANLKIAELTLAGSELSAVVIPQGGRYHASVDASVLDLEPWLHGSGPKVELAQKVRFPYELDFRIQRVKVGKGIELSAVQGVALGDDGRVASVRATGTTAQVGTIRVDLLEKEGAKRLEILSDQAGQMLKALGIFEDAEGGRLVLAATLDERSSKSRIDGQLDVNDFRVTRAPILARVLSIGSLDGIAELLQGGEGLTFSRALVPFVWSPGVVEIRDGRAIGAIGLTANGRVDRAAGEIDLRGSVFPAYTLNSVLGKIPFVGEFLVGGEDEGIFGIEYRVSGKLENPDVQVNPLMALAPGILRKMFVDPEEGRSEAGQ